MPDYRKQLAVFQMPTPFLRYLANLPQPYPAPPLNTTTLSQQHLQKSLDLDFEKWLDAGEIEFT